MKKKTIKRPLVVKEPLAIFNPDNLPEEAKAYLANARKELLRNTESTGGIEPYSREPMNALTLSAIKQHATAWAWERYHNHRGNPKAADAFMRTLMIDAADADQKWQAWLDTAKKTVIQLRLNPDITADALGIGALVRDYNNGREVEMQSSAIPIPAETYDRQKKKGCKKNDNRVEAFNILDNTKRDDDLFQTAHTDLVRMPLGARYEASSAIGHVIGQASKARTDRDKERTTRLKDAPYAESGRERIKTCRKNAPKGGKATAHYTDAEITNAFTTFKQRNPGKSAWAASSSLIREGQPLDSFGEAQGPYKRIQRIASVSQGITRDAWYGAL